MPGNFKVTFFFETMQQATVGAGAALGWTETWYVGNSEKSIDQIFQLPDVLKYIQLRRAILTTAVRMPFLRVSDDNNPRLVKIQSLAGMLGQVSKFAQNSADSQVQCAILLDLQKLPISPLEPVHHRRFLIRGLSSSLINGNILNTASPVWGAVTAFADFVGQKATGSNAGPGGTTQLGIRYHDPAADWVNISTAQATGVINLKDTLTVIPVLPGLVRTPYPSKVEVRDFQDPLKPFNKTWSFIGYTGPGPVFDSMILGKSRGNLPGNTYPPDGGGTARMREVRWKYGPVSQYALIGLRNKKTGRVFRQLRGRTSNRR